jgi:hypothetical protein
MTNKNGVYLAPSSVKVVIPLEDIEYYTPEEIT